MTLYNQYAFVFMLLVVGFVAGYLLGRVDFICARLATSRGENNTPQPKGFSFKPDSTPGTGKAAAVIDERKYVAPIKTDGLAKAADTTLGKTTTTADDIQYSVSKLAQLKGK
jgi:hypothetical protein